MTALQVLDWVLRITGGIVWGVGLLALTGIGVVRVFIWAAGDRAT